VNTIIGVLAALGYGLVCAISLYRVEHRPHDSWVVQGTHGALRGLSPAEREVLFFEVVRQQRRAYGLLWFAVAIGIVLSTTTIARVVLAPGLDLELLGSAIALAGDLTLGTFAKRLYDTTSKRLDKLVQAMTGSGDAAA